MDNTTMSVDWFYLEVTKPVDKHVIYKFVDGGGEIFTAMYSEQHTANFSQVLEFREREKTEPYAWMGLSPEGDHTIWFSLNEGPRPIRDWSESNGLGALQRGMHRIETIDWVASVDQYVDAFKGRYAPDQKWTMCIQWNGSKRDGLKAGELMNILTNLFIAVCYCMFG